VARYPKTQVPSDYERLLMARMGTGFSRRTWKQMEQAGGAKRWFRAQLKPHRVEESARALALADWFPDLAHTAIEQVTNNDNETKRAWQYARDLAAVTILRRAYSNRPVLEMMTDFWSNHLHIPANADLPWMWRSSYDALLRTHALGTFEDLLREATLHPAMVLYLDTFRSRRRTPNENHGRELLELHTVGRNGGYDETMVKDAARILSGYWVDAWNTWQPSYKPEFHALGPVSVLGFEAVNAEPDGQAVTLAFLKHLAHHPATAHTLARRLAVKFVSDEPSEALVQSLADVYLAHDTAIAPVLRALVASDEFKASAGAKVRTPVEDLVATMRALDVKAKAPRRDSDFAIALPYVHGSVQVYQWPMPDGAPEDSAPWSTPSRLLSSFNMHWGQVSGGWPSNGVAYHSTKHWVPKGRLRLDAYVDHLSRTLFGMPAPAWLVRTALQATGLRADEVVSRRHEVASWLGVRLIGALLDTPLHMTR
jgi:uncharacterized protein (DUF1800 family)